MFNKKILLYSLFVALIIAAVIITFKVVTPSFKVVGPSLFKASLTTNPPVDDNSNIAIGNAALRDSTGMNNIALGASALRDNSDGTGNIALGPNALAGNTGGGNSIALGSNALSNNSSGWDNFALGANALSQMTSGHDNVAIGVNALSSNTSGMYNFAVGTNAGNSTQTSSNSMYLGINTSPLQDGDTNEIVIGNSIQGAGSNSVTLGNSSIAKTLLQGSVGIGTVTPAYKLDVAGAINFTGTLRQNGVTVSSSNYLTAAGINIYNNNSGNVGIGTKIPAAKLDVNGVIRTAPVSSATCDSATKGGIYYNSTKNHFYGCNGTAWKQLDN